MELEIGRGKKARRAYGFDEISILPQRRTRDVGDVDIGWKLGPHLIELPLLSSPMDGTTSPALAIELGRLGGLGVLDLEGLWARHEDAGALLAEVAELDDEAALVRLRELYAAPLSTELMVARVREIKAAGVLAAGSLSPLHVREHHRAVVDAGLDVLVIHGTVVSAEHVSTSHEPVNLKDFIATVGVPVAVGGCASYQAALHLMRAGAAAILVGVGPGAACTTRAVLGVGVPQPTALADAAAARVQHLLETGRYVAVVADGGLRNGGDIAKAVACGADAVMAGTLLARASEAPGSGRTWGRAAFHVNLPRGASVTTGTRGPLREIVLGPATTSDGAVNLMGALRRAMATCGFETIHEFQKAEIMVVEGAG